jgi:uncharacterized protein (TIGR00255 family)
MTGFGESHFQSESLTVALEVRTINSRYFKCTARLPEGYAALESKIEPLARQHIKRGTVSVQVQIRRAHAAQDYQIDGSVLVGYFQQLEAVARSCHIAQPVSLDSLLLLPGVVIDGEAGSSRAEEAWPVVEGVLNEALARLNGMRAEEGAALAADLEASCLSIGDCLESIALLAPRVMEGYRGRLAERVSKALEEFQVQVNASDLMREVSLFSERCDISEELVRLRSHVDQFRQTMALPESSGRKLEFLAQEMFREANTIGAKANDVEIARHSVEMKAAIERIREQVQNVE